MVKKRIVPLLMVMSLIFSNVASAESQNEVVTYSGHDIQCSLVCNFSLRYNDKATAKTNWAGKKEFRVEVNLYQCQSAVSKYKLIDKDYGDRGAVAKGSVAGVWKFKSKHYVANPKHAMQKKQCTLTDL